MSGEHRNPLPWGQAAMASSIRDRIYRLPDEKITLTPLPAQLCTPHFLGLPDCRALPLPRQPGSSLPVLTIYSGFLLRVSAFQSWKDALVVL